MMRALGSAFREPTKDLVPLFVLASIFMIFRSFYFGQVIFFGGSSTVELFASGAMVATAGLFALLLVPTRGAHGAAIALMLGQIASCAVYIAAGNSIYKMPVPWRDATAISGLALAGYVGATLVERMTASPWIFVPLETSLLLSAFAAAALRYNVLGLKNLPVKNMLRNLAQFPVKHGN